MLAAATVARRLFQLCCYTQCAVAVNSFSWNVLHATESSWCHTHTRATTCCVSNNVACCLLTIRIIACVHVACLSVCLWVRLLLLHALLSVCLSACPCVTLLWHCMQGFGFVTFATSCSAESARLAMNGAVVDGRKIEVLLASSSLTYILRVIIPTNLCGTWVPASRRSESFATWLQCSELFPFTSVWRPKHLFTKHLATIFEYTRSSKR